MKRKIALIGMVLGVSCLLLVSSIGVKADGFAEKNDTATETDGSAEGLHTIAENNTFRFDYDEAGADIYVTDKRTGKVWSNVVDANYYKEELANWNVMSQLMTVTFAKENGNISMVNVFDNGEKNSSFDLIAKYEKNELLLNVSLTSADISFEIRAWLDETGLNYEIPWDSVKENSTNMLVNIQMMPTFGAAVSGEDGYIMLPDGSGTLINYKNYDDPNAKLYTYSFYGTDQLDINQIQTNAEQGYYGLMLPVCGMSHHDGAILTAVVEGEADTVLNVAPSGFKFKGLNRTYLTFNYRTYNSVQVDGTDYIQIIPQVNKTDRAVKIFFLDEQHNTYSDMAVAYREYLEQEGILKENKSSDDISLVVDLVMGANETGLFGSKLISATTYKQAAEIVNSLSKNVPSLSVTLEGWGKGGYDTLPTNPKLERKFGGKNGWKELVQACEKKDVQLYLNMDFVNADKETGSFNNRKDTVRLAQGGIVNLGDRYLLNPTKVLKPMYEKAIKKLDLQENESIRFDAVGSILTYDFSKDNPCSRTVMQEAYEKVLKQAAKKLNQVAVSGGNQYVLPYATLLSDIPDKHSDYYFGDKSVPFYQIVVHGSVDYTSLPGNRAYDLQQQKLKWIETGSLPYFILTYESPIVLNKTSYNDLFSSQYSVWKEDIEEISKEFNEKLADVWNQKIQKHEEKDGAVIVTYEDNSRIYINYSETAIQADGIEIPAMDYVVVKGE